jgi:menaquinone reductase, integral membrane subunit
MLVTATVEKVTGRRLVPQDLFRRLGFISGILLGIYVAAKAIDTLIWLNITSPSVGFAPWQYYIHKPFGTPILFAEIVLFGLVPAFLLTFRRTAARRGWLLSAAALACAGVLLNRFVLTVQTLAVPTLAFDDFLQYTPSWQEVASFAGVIAYGVIVYSLSYRYLPLFAPPKGENTNVSGD